MKKKSASLCLIVPFLFLIAGKAAYSHENHKNLLLESIGGLSAQAVYLTYVSIGSLADGYVYKAFDKKTTNGLLDEYKNMARNSQNILQKLINKNAISGNDANFARDMISTYDLLIDEAEAFKKYVATGDKVQAKIYDNKRKLAWKNIARLLNLK